MSGGVPLHHPYLKRMYKLGYKLSLAVSNRTIFPFLVYAMAEGCPNFRLQICMVQGKPPEVILQKIRGKKNPSWVRVPKREMAWFSVNWDEVPARWFISQLLSLERKTDERTTQEQSRAAGANGKV